MRKKSRLEILLEDKLRIEKIKEETLKQQKALKKQKLLKEIKLAKKVQEKKKYIKSGMANLINERDNKIKQYFQECKDQATLEDRKWQYQRQLDEQMLKEKKELNLRRVQNQKEK